MHQMDKTRAKRVSYVGVALCDYCVIIYIQVQTLMQRA